MWFRSPRLHSPGSVSDAKFKNYSPLQTFGSLRPQHYQLSQKNVSPLCKSSCGMYRKYVTLADKPAAVLSCQERQKKSLSDSLGMMSGLRLYGYRQF